MTVSLTEDQIAARLKNAMHAQSGQPPYADTLYPPGSTPIEHRPAAVLIPLLKENGSWQVLFTRRNADLAEHSGQVAFPGGRSDPGDASPEATALREAHEEIGLNPGDVRLLGRLHDFITITNYRVTPVVGRIPWPYPLRPSPVEVSRIFTIPLEWLADPHNFEEKHRSLPATGRSASVIYYQPYDQEILWGASARFTLTLLQSLELI